MSSANHALDVLPEVVWREVAKNLSPADCLSLYNCSSYFRELLEPSMMRWNFKNVLPSILGREERMNYAYGVIAPTFLISKTDMLNCRLVCKAWRAAMDDFLDNLQETSEVPNFRIHFHNENQIDRLMTDITNYSLTQTKFLWKNIQLGVRNEEEDFEDPNPMADEALNAFWEKCYVLLQSIGMRISRIYIDGNEDYTPAGALSLTKIVQRCLKRMPNLKELHIGNMELMDHFHWGQHLENEIDEIGEYLANNSFPHLPHLKSLIMPSSEIPASLIDHLMRVYAPQLESLCAGNWEAIPRRCEFQRFANLRKLVIAASDVEEIVLDDLNFLDNLNCPLESLRLLTYKRHEPLSVVKFLEKIQHLPIKDLNIDLSLSYEESIPETIRLKTVKFLYLVTNSTSSVRFPSPPKLSLDFLECFENLEELEFEWWQDANNELPLFGNENKIHLNEHLNDDGNIYQSNIWDVLPKLTKIKYERFRERARRLQEQQELGENLDHEDLGENGDEEPGEDLDDEDPQEGFDDEDPQEDLEDEELDGDEDEDFHRERIYTRQNYEHFLNSIR